ncbi:S8 family serine peptidase [Inconstantimicrobium porci]|uniref:S8 family serine peptidase n=2 Tax=Inconstantimicrobium porci TaxID=2652291 RepID=A0A7X2MZZ1_9CLOT|nr:S8 family serine peptidase [Inconstantimicrobium porci]MDD6769350.1 S8 family serine peptidase [Inconstantimicrobium porci]MSR92153.1 S8 family serine peptidase [Inconstantimicrobium porci]
MKSVHAYTIGDAKMQNAEKMKITDVTKNFSKEILEEKTKGDLKESYNTKGKAMDPEREVWVVVQMKSDSPTYFTNSTEKNNENTVLTKAVEENSKTTADSKKDNNKSDFKGSGMKVAVIDTGLDYKHSAFKKSPAYYSMTKETISNVFSDTIAYQETSCDVDTVFKSAKVPYTFDYADVDEEVMPTEASVTKYGNDHGTHVAGIIAGNDDKLTGVAPDAQLMIMKVFSDKSGGAQTVDILAALNDSVILGADVINMSLGSSGGFESEESDSLISRIYNSVSNNGINLVVSAGNAFSSSYSSTAGDMPLSTNPDTGIIGSPSSYDSSLSVASINSYAPKNIIAGGKSIAYTDISGHSIIKELKADSFGISVFDNCKKLSKFTVEVSVVHLQHLQFILVHQVMLKVLHLQ